MNSINNSAIDEKCFPKTIYQEITEIKTAIGENESLYKAEIKTLVEFHYEHRTDNILSVQVS